MNSRPRAKSWPRGPQNAWHSCVAFHMPSFQLFRSTGQKPQLIRFGSLHFRDNLVSSFVQRESCISQKTTFLLPWHHTTRFFSRTLSDHLHYTNRPFTYVLRNVMSTLSRRSKRTQFRNNVLNLNEISRKSNLNYITWLKFCDKELYNSYNFKLFRDLVQGSTNIFLARSYKIVLNSRNPNISCGKYLYN